MRIRRVPLACSVAAVSADNGVGVAGHASPSHHFMQRAASIWIRSLGGSDVGTEIQHGDYRVDVFSRKANVVVEVGNTSIGKLKWLVLTGRHGDPSFVLIPFQRASDWCDQQVPSLSLIAIEFLWSEDLTKDETARFEQVCIQVGDALSRRSHGRRRQIR